MSDKTSSLSRRQALLAAGLVAVASSATAEAQGNEMSKDEFELLREGRISPEEVRLLKRSGFTFRKDGTDWFLRFPQNFKSRVPGSNEPPRASARGEMNLRFFKIVNVRGHIGKPEGLRIVYVRVGQDHADKSSLMDVILNK